MAALEAEHSVQSEIREFIEEVMHTNDQISVEKLVRLAHAHFDKDPWMQEALIREGLNSLVPGIAGMVKHRRRSEARRLNDPATRRSRIASVFEHVGGGYSKTLLTMTRPEHLFAAQEREVAAAGHLRWANFHRAVAQLHKDNVTLTGALSPSKVDQLWKEHIERD